VVELANGLCGAQKQQGHEVTVVATNLDWDTVLDVPLDRPVSIGDIDVEYFPIDRWTLRVPFSTIRRFAVSSRLQRSLRIRVPHFDIVHIHAIYLYPSLVACALSRRANVPYVISPYGNLDPVTHSHHRLIKNTYLALFERRDLNGAAAIHFMSEGERAAAETFIATPRSRVINLGLPPEKFLTLPPKGTFRTSHPELSSKRLIMYLGRISYSKGLDLLPASLGLVARAQPDAHLLIVGPDHEGYGKVVRRLLMEHGVEDRVTFAGMISEREKLSALVDADVFVFPSYTEGFGIAMLEAMACGTPVVLSDRASLAPELAAARAVVTTELRSESIAAAIEKLLTNDSEVQQMVGTARELVASRFMWPSVARTFLDLYEDCVDFSQGSS
jgi:glycosyltransferase involved in cell wall biosynthesis